MILNNDTIAAIATALSNSGIGIIRVSGIDSINIVDKLFRNKNKKQCLKEYNTHTIHYGYIFSDGNIIDEVMISVMKAPNTFTMEETVEINCHGGVLVMNKILGLVIENGARLAEPGEFSKRAFLNGRIDLSKAEAIMELIHAKNDISLKTSIRQLSGSIYNEISQIRDGILYEIAFIESALDDPEHVSLDGYYDGLIPKIDKLISKLEKMENSFKNGKIIKEGIQTVIVGKPNVGKSSLLNYMSGSNRAIVTDIAGTTRDILEQEINIDGIHLNMIDTAGIRSTDDIIEKIGVEKSKEYINEADLILYMIDASIPINQDDIDIIKSIKDKKSIILLNKSDLKTVVNQENINNIYSEINNNYDDLYILEISVKEDIGLDNFKNLIRKLFIENKIDFDEEVTITNLRHLNLIKEAKSALVLVRKSIEDEMPEDFLSIDMMNAYISLGLIIGEEVNDDVVNEIFSKFCTGK